MDQTTGITCPNCDQRYRLPASANGRRVACKQCGHEFQVDFEKQTAEMPISIFDSLDIDSMLNSPNSGLGLPRRAPKPQPPTAQPPTGDVAQQNPNDQSRGAPATPDPSSSPVPSKKQKNKRQKKRDRRNQREDQKNDPAKKPSFKQPLPRVKTIEEELAPSEPSTVKKPEFAWAKSKIAPPSEEEFLDALGNKVGGERQEIPDSDPEEQAIFWAVTRSNQRKNFVVGFLAASLSFFLGGYFVNAQWDELTRTLNAQEREALEQRGFNLTAEIQGPVDEDGQLAQVRRKPGIRFDQMFPPDGSQPDDQRLAGGDNTPLLRNQNAGRRPAGNRIRRNPRAAQRPQRRPNPIKFEFDTANLTADVKSTAVVAQTFPEFNRSATALSPRGHFYIAGQSVIRAMKRDLATRIDQRSIALPSRNVSQIAASPDGRYVAVGGPRGEMVVYSIDRQGQFTATIPIDSRLVDRIDYVSFSPDGQQLIAFSADGKMSAWQVGPWSQLKKWEGLNGVDRVNSIRTIGNAVYLGGRELFLKVDLETKSITRLPFERRCRYAVLDSVIETMVYIDDRRIGAVDWDTKRLLWSKTIRSPDRANVRLSPDGQTAFFVDGGAVMLQFEIRTGTIVQRYASQKDNRIAISPDGTQAITSHDRQYRVHEIVGGKSRIPIQLADPVAVERTDYPPPLDEATDKRVVDIVDGQVQHASLTDSGLLLTLMQDDRLFVYDVGNGSVLHEAFGIKSRDVTAMKTVGDRLLLGKRSGAVEIFRVEKSGKLALQEPMQGHSNAVSFILPMVGSPEVATVATSGRVRIWNVTTREVKFDRQLVSFSPVSAVVDSASNLWLASRSELAKIIVDRSTVKLQTGRRNSQQVLITPDSRRLVLVNGKKVTIAGSRKGNVVSQYDLPVGLRVAAISSDSKNLLACGGGNIRIFRISGGKEIGIYGDASIDQRSQITVSDDGLFLIPIPSRQISKLAIFSQQR